MRGEPKYESCPEGYEPLGDCAERCGINLKSLHNLYHRGDLPCVRVKHWIYIRKGTRIERVEMEIKDGKRRAGRQNKYKVVTV